MKAPIISRRVWVVASTVAVIGGFFAYYFFVYMEARREELEAKKFRALAQYADNIKGAYGERTKKLLVKYSLGECNKHSRSEWPAGCDSISEFKQARLDVIEPTIAQSDFSELVFDVGDSIERQTFRNSIDKNIIDTLLEKDDAAIKRQVEFTVNDKEYVVFIHTFDLAKKTWRILGFCEKHLFESQVRAVDLKYIVVASLLLILLLLMMPLLKLLIMNESEKLHMTNVWFCGFSLVAGTSFLLLIALMSNDFSATYSSRDNSERPDSLIIGDSLTREGRITKLSIEVERRFLGELRKIYDQIEESNLKCDSGYSLCENEGKTKLYSRVPKGKIQFTHYPFFNEILWIQTDGSQDMAMATHDMACADVVNLKKRKYFSRALLLDSSWIMPNSGGNDRFALQSIHSYITNRHEAGFGVLRHKGDTSYGVIAIATKLHSVMDPLLPPGYQFVFIDESGKVWFHSRTEKNLNENFIDETGEDGPLAAAIKGRSTAMITLNYDRSNHLALVRPIQNTRLTLVVLHDDDYYNTPIVLSVAFAFLLLTMLFFTNGLLQLILLAGTYRFSLLKIKRFFLEWLRPEKEKRRIYRRAVWLQIFLIVPIAFIAVFNDSLDLVAFFWVLPIYLTVYHYFSLEYRRIVEEKENPKMSTWLHPFFIASFFLIVVANLAGMYLFDVQNFALLLIPQVFVVLILLFFYSWIVLQSFTVPALAMMATATNSALAYATRIALMFRLQPFMSRYDRSYCNFLFLWLILTSVIPTYYFYKVSYYEQGRIWMRYLHLAAAHEEESRDVLLNNELGPVFQDRVREMSAMGRFLTVTNEIDTTDSELNQSNATKRRPIDVFIFNDIPKLMGVAEETRAVIFPAAGDSKWLSHEEGHSSEIEYFTNRGERRFYRGVLPKFQLLKGYYGLFVVIMTVLGGIVLYRTLRFCITHIYGVGLLEHNKYRTPELLDVERLRYFIVGLPYSGKKKLVARIMGRQKNLEANCIATIDLSDDSPITIYPYCRLIVATRFHHELNNHKSNQKRFERLSKLLEYNNTPVIVISNSDPSTILEFYDKLADYYHNEKGDSELDGKFRECKQAYLSWSNLLNSFSIHYQWLKEFRPYEDKYINAELGHGDFLPRLYHQMNNPITNFRDREKMILQVEDLSRTYYRAIWNCLPTSEKFLLHDLAKDCFVNMRNIKSIRALRQKGLMVGKSSLQIMNKSFSNFILTAVGEDADVRMEQQIRQKGSWNTVHLILVITIISIVVFLGVAQEELFKNFQAIVAATAALLPLLARFGGIFSSSKAKE